MILQVSPKNRVPTPSRAFAVSFGEGIINMATSDIYVRYQWNKVLLTILLTQKQDHMKETNCIYRGSMNWRMTRSTSSHLVSEQDELIKLVLVPASFVSHYHAGEKGMKYMDRISTPKPTDVLDRNLGVLGRSSHLVSS